jgi:hypothetical protein
MPTLSTRNQFLLGTFLVLLLIMTRGHHELSFDWIPASTMGAFFLLGVYFRQMWVLTLTFVLIWTMDMNGLTWSADTEFCLKDSYLFLLLSYATYWAGGRLFAHLYAGETLQSLTRLAVIAPIAGALGYLIVSASFHHWSGLFMEDLSLMFGDYIARLPGHLEGLTVYLVIGVVAHLAISTWTKSARVERLA